MSLDETMTRADCARIVLDTTRCMADGYRKSRNEHDTPESRVCAEACAVAASNAGWFILQAMGYSTDQIKAMDQ